MTRKTTYSDKKILNAMCSNSTEGWEFFCSEYNPLIQSIVRWPKWNFTEDEQQDVFQDIHMNLQSAIPKFKGQSSLSWFIKQIALRQCVNEIRRQKRWRDVMTPLVQKKTNGSWNEMEMACPDTLDPHSEAIQNERHQSLRSAMEHLNKTCMDSIKMFYLQHLSYREMASRLGISKNTVGSRLAKCLEKLHKTLCRNPSFGKD